MSDQLEETIDDGVRLEHHRTVLNTISNRAARILQLDLVALTALVGVVSIGGRTGSEAPTLHGSFTTWWGIFGSVLLAGGFICGLAVLSYETFDPPVACTELPTMVDAEEKILDNYQERIRKAGQVYQISQLISVSGLVFIIGGILTEADSLLIPNVPIIDASAPVGAIIVATVVLVGVSAVLFDVHFLNYDPLSNRDSSESE